MRDETAEVAGDAAGVFADAQAGGFVVHHPDPHDGVAAIEIGQLREGLIDAAFLAVFAVVALHHGAVLDQGDVAAFAAELGFCA